jgi:integrase
MQYVRAAVQDRRRCRLPRGSFSGLIRTVRQNGPDVWEYRWREPGADGKRKHRRIVVGSVEQYTDKSEALRAISALRRDINLADARLKAKPITLSELVDHYRQRELTSDNAWKTYSTRKSYQGYLNKWIVPRWGDVALSRIRAGEVEQWLRSLPLARSSCAKIRNVMSMIFNHGIRHELYDRNPIRWVRQSAKRRKIPAVLDVTEIRMLLDSLQLRERTLVLLDAGTGLRMSELFGLKWKDVNFQSNEISVTRSIVMQVVGPCKTEASQKRVPLDANIAEALVAWRRQTLYREADDWIFASPATNGRRPYWGQPLMRKVIQPDARAVGITKPIGWHTFRHTYSTLLRANRTDIKVMQELMRHASSRVTMDTYTQAITAQKRKAQSEVVGLILTGWAKSA